jgi:hypothetical protein
MVAFGPMPRANVVTTLRVKPGRFAGCIANLAKKFPSQILTDDPTSRRVCFPGRELHFGPLTIIGSKRSLLKTCMADSRSRGNDQLKAKLLRPFGERSDLLLAIPGFIVFGSFVNVRVSVFDEPVEQAG